MPTEAEVQAALDSIIHPTFGLSLGVLQMVRAIRITADRLEVDLVMNCPGCPAGEATLAKVHQALRALDRSGGSRVVVRLRPEIWTPPF